MYIEPLVAAQMNLEQLMKMSPALADFPLLKVVKLQIDEAIKEVEQLEEHGAIK